MDLDQPKKFNVGDRVFVKVRGFAHWPAKIEGITESKKPKYNIIFCGTDEPGTVKYEDLFSYEENKDKFKKGSTSKYFLKGIKELEKMPDDPDPVLTDSDKDDTDEVSDEEDVEIDEQVDDTDVEDDDVKNAGGHADAYSGKDFADCSHPRKCKNKSVKRMATPPSKVDTIGKKKKRGHKSQ